MLFQYCVFTVTVEENNLKLIGTINGNVCCQYTVCSTQSLKNNNKYILKMISQIISNIILQYDVDATPILFLVRIYCWTLDFFKVAHYKYHFVCNGLEKMNTATLLTYWTTVQLQCWEMTPVKFTIQVINHLCSHFCGQHDACSTMSSPISLSFYSQHSDIDAHSEIDTCSEDTHDNGESMQILSFWKL